MSSKKKKKNVSTSVSYMTLIGLAKCCLYVSLFFSCDYNNNKSDIALAVYRKKNHQYFVYPLILISLHFRLSIISIAHRKTSVKSEISFYFYGLNREFLVIFNIG